jgi:hypothetical protein
MYDFRFKAKETQESFGFPFYLFVGHSRLVHMAFEIRFATDGMEVTVFRQVGGKPEVTS